MSETRKTFSITFNKGIDKASLPFEASPARALDALNYVYRDGKVQKRFGVNMIAHAPTVYFVPEGGSRRTANTKTINGIWRFLAEDDQYHTIVHIGRLLFEYKEVDGGYTLTFFAYGTIRPINSHLPTPLCHDLLDAKSVAVIGNKSLYVFGGKHLLRVRFKPEEEHSCTAVYNDPDTYIPTTTVSITYQNAKVSGRASLDQVNLMTGWRKNRLLSGVGLNDGGNALYGSTVYGYVYQLDGPIVEKNFSRTDIPDMRVEDVRIKISRRKI